MIDQELINQRKEEIKSLEKWAKTYIIVSYFLAFCSGAAAMKAYESFANGDYKWGVYRSLATILCGLNAFLSNRGANKQKKEVMYLNKFIEESMRGG